MPYSITTKDGIIINNIPDDVAPDSLELKQRVASIRAGGGQDQPLTTPSMADQLLRQAGLTARAVGPVAAGATLGGMMAGPPGAAVGALGVGLGQMVGDPLVGLYNRAMGTNVPTPSQSMESLMTRAGLPEPATPTERVVQDITRAGASATGFARGSGQFGATMLAGRQMAGQPAGIAPEVLGLLARYPAQQVSGAALAGGAGGMLREGDVGTAGQMVGSMAAGMVAPGGPKLPITQRVMGAPKTLVQPFTEEGRQVIIGGVLNKLANNPAAAQARLAEAAPLVPGVRPTTAGAAYDTGLAGAETAIKALDQSGAFGAQITSNQQALLDAYQKISGKPGSIAYAKEKREGLTAPMREQAFGAVTVKPEIFQSSIDLVVNQAVKNVIDSPVGVRLDVENAMNWATSRIAKARNPEELYEVRKDLAAAAQGKYNQDIPSLRLAKGQLADVIRSIDDVIEAAAPGYATYMSKYKKMSKPIDQMRLLQDIEEKVTTGLPNIVTQQPVLEAAKLRRQLITRADEIGVDLSAPAQRRLDNIIDEINRGMAASAPGIKVPGSDTFKNMSMGNFIGKLFSESLATNTTLRTMSRPLDFLYRLPDDKLQQLLVEAMLDPQLAAVMMSKANMMKVEPLATSLRQKAIQMGMGTAIGAGQ